MSPWESWTWLERLMIVAAPLLVGLAVWAGLSR